VVLPVDLLIPEINDSKKLSPKKREKLYNIIMDKAISVGIGIVHENKIDEINILNATILSMNRAIEDLDVSPDILLVDGNLKNICLIKQESIIKGDSKSQSIAAASIIAKVTRDNIMKEYDKVFPGYGLAKNMGYGTKEHMGALKTMLSTPIHRQSFKPVEDCMPSLKNIDDMPRLSIQIAASRIIKDGHNILDVNYKDSHIISFFNDNYNYFVLNDNTHNIKDKSISSLKDLLSKKDTTHSVNISVISVQFSKDKPKVIFKKYD